jgi:hypothetical protein
MVNLRIYRALGLLFPVLFCSPICPLPSGAPLSNRFHIAHGGWVFCNYFHRCLYQSLEKRDIAFLDTGVIFSAVHSRSRRRNHVLADFAG